MSVRVEKLTKSFGKVEVLEEVSFTIEDGEFVVLLGPSGCGKSTLLRCIAGLERPDSGSIYLGELWVNDIPSRDRDLAMVFQGFSLFPLMTVRENIAFPLKVRGASRQAMDDRVKEVGKLLSIERILEKMPRELSGGEQQRVAIGRAIARSPKAFLMDEPLSSLDAPLRSQLRSELKKLQKEIGVTTLYVTHDQTEALALADKIGVINSGALLQFGTTQEVFRSPSSAFVARFVGDPQANILKVTIVDGQGRGGSPRHEVVLGDDLSCPIPEETARKVLEQSERKRQQGVETGIQISIRPEDVELVQPGSSLEGTIKGKVILDEPLTLYRLVSVLLGNGNEKDTSAPDGAPVLKLVAARDLKAGIGQEVALRLNIEKAHFFDSETGERLV